MINTKNFEFFLKFVILGFLKLRSPKRSPQNCQNIGDYLKNLKISCFLDLQLWISFETSFSNFELKKKNPCAHFGIHKRSPKRSPWSSETKNTPKSWRKFELHLFQSTLNCHSGAPFWAPIFTYLKSAECQLSLEQKIIVVSFLEIFLAPCEYECCEKSIFGAPEPHSGLQNWKCPITFLKICVRALQSGIKIWVFIESSWFLIPDNIQNLPNHIIEKYSERSPKRSPPIFSNFEIFKNWSEFSHF